MGRIIGVDVGGTFTDVVVAEGGAVTGSKVPTTEDQAVGVSGAVAGRATDTFLHGTTAATNTLLEERGAVVGLVTDAGYEDVIEIGRQDRPSLYDSSIDRPTPLVSRELRVSDPKDLGECDIVAVCLIDAYRDPSAELAFAERLDRPVVLSSVVSPEFREYERVATTALSAYLTPSVAGYLGRLDSVLPMDRRLVMTSAGGLLPFHEGAGFAGRLVLSGPAGGVVAAAALGRHHGHESILSFDMGGTSTDVCRITGGVPQVGMGHTVAGRVNRVPSVPIRTIGAGGGSIAWIDAGGALRVGPMSAGSSPGPAAYGRGGLELTVTDANVLAGNIPSSLRLGGSVELDLPAARDAAERISGRLGMAREALVEGVLEVVDSHMEAALRSVSVEEGADPRDAVLVAFGGAGGLHASRLARRLGMRKVMVPPHSGVFSALGLLLSSPRADAAITVMLAEHDARVETEITRMRVQAAETYASMFGSSPDDVIASADLRYVGQSHEIEVGGASDWATLRTAFEKAHREAYGFDRPGEPIEVVNVRAAASGSAPLAWSSLSFVGAEVAPRTVDGVWPRGLLPVGFEVEGPAVVVEDNSAVLLEPGDQLVVLDDGTLQVTAT